MTTDSRLRSLPSWPTLQTLPTLPPHLRQLFAAFLLVIATGYTLGVFFVDHTTDAHPDGIAERFLGSEGVGVDPADLPADRDLQYEKTAAELLNITHTHIISLALVFLAVGGIFAMAVGVPAWLRAVLILEPFASILLTFGGMWLLRYHSPSWSFLIALSGVLMSACFYTMVGVSLWQLMRAAPHRK
ncbi:MAG: hypothetical protein JXA28_01895 [Bacteroidetes bacterium]|nr:hypothetical protein [Bacteroidota bacterium]